MKLTSKEFQSVEYEGRHLDFLPGQEYDIQDTGLASFLLRKGFTEKIQKIERKSGIREIKMDKPHKKKKYVKSSEDKQISVKEKVEE